MKTKQEIELEIESAQKDLKYYRDKWLNNDNIGVESSLLVNMKYYEYKIYWLEWVLNETK